MDFGAKAWDLRELDRTLIIAEIGVNHNGMPELARALVDEAAAAGADIVKFQAFRSEREISRYAPKAGYQKETTSAEGGQLEMCKALELSGPDLMSMMHYCRTKDVGFLCTAFDYESLALLTEEMKVNTVKIASSEVTDLPFLECIGSKDVAAILSTGASTLTEVSAAVDVLQRSGCRELMLFHCVSSYPAPNDEVNLRVMQTMKSAFGLPVGFSDHTIGCHVAIGAAALGAVAIEKHFTLDRSMPGPDHRSSIEPAELRELVAAARAVNAAMGDGIKRPARCELANLPLIRKSIVAARDLLRGTTLNRDMIEIKRPAGGIEPGDLQKVMGRTLKHDVGTDMQIQWSDLA